MDTLKEYIYNNYEKLEGYSYTQYENNESIANLLEVIWDNYDTFSSDKKLDVKLQNAVKYIKNVNVLRYLLAENLIEGDFYEFISPTQFESLSSPEQITFVQNALARHRSDTDFEINDESATDKIIKMLDAIGIDYNYVYSSSILEKLIQYGDDGSVSQMIEGMSEVGRGATGKDKERFIDNKIRFINKVITWLYDHESEIDDGDFILLGYPMYEYWPEYFVEALKNKDYRPNAIRYALDYFAKDGEIESEYDSSLIGYLIKAGYIDQYEAEIDNSRLSDEDKEIVRKRIKDIAKDVARNQ